MRLKKEKKGGGSVGRITAKQKRFVNEYLVDLNATKAAIRAGYSVRTARAIAAENLTKPYIQKQIQKEMADRAARIEVTQDKVIRELGCIAFANIFDYLKIQDNKIVILNMEQIPLAALPAIAGIKETECGVSFRLCDKLRALELLGRHLGMFKDKVEISGSLENPFVGLTTEELKQLAKS